MAKLSEYTIKGPPVPGTSPSQLHKTLTIRRDNNAATPDLRALYRHSAEQPESNSPVDPRIAGRGVPTTPNLPPTPPAANGESTVLASEEKGSESAVFRSKLVTPVNQNSPPTPDHTPPRPQRHLVIKPFLGPQASFASTRAESFKTAQEDFISDEDSVVHAFQQGVTQSSPLINEIQATGESSQTGLLRSPLFTAEKTALSPSHAGNKSLDDETPTKPMASHSAVEKPELTSNALPESRMRTAETSINPALRFRTIETAQTEEFTPLTAPQNSEDANVRRGPSLRDRLKAARRDFPSASTEKFASIIGWNDGVSEGSGAQRAHLEDAVVQEQENKRLSGLSTNSTISAMVIERSPLPRRHTTLRKVAKNNSLRSASSPLPTPKKTPHFQSDSPHRLVHKKMRLSNENRLSFGSEATRPHSFSSSAVLPKAEIIKVAVIPERNSSLQSSANSSKRHSLSDTSMRTHSKKPSDGLPPSSWQRKRTLSESDRGREKQQALVVPPRSSSLSASTSRNTSRANSITSENLRTRRQAAETDLRKTLDRMESERLLLSLKGSQFDQSPVETPSKPPQLNQLMAPAMADGGRSKSLTPGTSEWAALRPPSFLATPFSQPSYQSASPEINEATAINFFPHNNRSLQLIEPNMMQESRAVQEVRKQAHIKDETSSPLRNPRHPPEPPEFAVIPPTPAEEMSNQLGSSTGDRHWGLTRNRPSQPRSDSFIKTMTRGLSLKNARNRKADQELDGSLHPFWRPRAFWDDETDGIPHPVGTERGQSVGLVNNSLGLPQERTIITGPVSLVRRISERRKQNRSLVKQSSRGSISRLQVSRQLYKAPIMGLNLRFMGLRDIQDRLLYARQRKEDEKLEKRRAALRQSIGANVISQGDSRFPASDSSLARV